MLITKKMLLALTLVAAMLGGGVGALITHSAKAQTDEASTNTTQAAAPATDKTLVSYQANKTPEQIEEANAALLKTTEEQTAYRQGFSDGFNVCGNGVENAKTQAAATSRTSSSASSRRVYYDYNNQPRGRTFWQKHRDKLTMAIGTGGGAILGGIIGGKKGAGIGALAGLGGSALYTYKLRHRSRRY